MLIPIIGLLLLLPLMVASGLAIKKFDLRPSRVYNKRYLKYFVPLFLAGVIISFLLAYQGVDFGYSYYYLTQDLKLIEHNHYFGFKIYDGKDVHKIKIQDYDFDPFAEEDNYVYAESYDSILKINMSDYEAEILYHPPKGRHFTWPRKVGKTIAFMENKRGYSDRQLVLFDIPTQKVSRIPLDIESLKGYSSLSLFGADKSKGKEFWFMFAWSQTKGRGVFRLWEDGKPEYIKDTQVFPLYIRPYLITYSENEIVISKEKEGQFETTRKVPNSKGYIFLGMGYWPWFWTEDLGDVTIKEIFGHKYRSKEEREKGPLYARLDLETFEIEELSDTKKWLYCFGPNEYYFEDKDYDAGTFAIYRFQEGRSELIRSFRISFKKTFYPYGIFEGGIVLERGKKVKVYAFPDLREIKFKKL